jgi:hypothetical protein
MRSARYGVLSATDWKSSMLSSTSAALAIAKRWRTFISSKSINHVKARVRALLTALVDPPKMLTMAMALRKELRVKISLEHDTQHPGYNPHRSKIADLGLISKASRFLRYFAAMKHS